MMYSTVLPQRSRYNDVLHIKEAPTQSNLGRLRCYHPRRRMHSPAACASCRPTMCNVTDPLRNVTGALRSSYGTLRVVT